MRRKHAGQSGLKPASLAADPAHDVQALRARNNEWFFGRPDGYRRSDPERRRTMKRPRSWMAAVLLAAAMALAACGGGGTTNGGNTGTGTGGTTSGTSTTGGTGTGGDTSATSTTTTTP
jgi:hypothetical protein